MQVFQNAAAGQPANDGTAASDPGDQAMAAYPPLGDTTAPPDMRDPASDQYPLAIQGPLGDGVSAQPYTDALSQLSLNTAPPQSQLYVVQKGDTLSPLSYGEGPTIAMAEADHEQTASYRNSARAKAYRQAQADLIRQGDFRAAQEMDIQDIRQKFGNKYDGAIQQMLKYSQERGYW